MTGSDAKTGSASLTVMAFDFGFKRIGTAVGESLIGSAQELKTVPNSQQGPHWHLIERLVRDWRPDAFVLGLPLPADGNTRTAMVVAVRAFGDEVASRFDRPVHYIDEHLSSHAADIELRAGVAQGKRISEKKITSRDSVAARLILQSWFESR